MSESRHAVKVGLFFFVGLVLIALLLVVFSKGLRMTARTYELRLRAPSVAGLTARSDVLLRGIRIGQVREADLAPDGRGVIIRLKVSDRYRIHRDARFVIEQIGFLGDQYVAIYPEDNQAPLLEPGDEVWIEAPFNLQEVVRSTSGLVQRFDQTVSNFNMMIQRVDQMVLNERNLTNLATTLENFRATSDDAMATVEEIRKLVETNAPSATLAVTNLARFSEEVVGLAGELQAAVATNRHRLTEAIHHFESTSEILNQLAQDLEAGKGLAGSLFKDAELQENLREALFHVRTAASNIANYGLLYKPRKPKAEPVSPPPHRTRFPWR